jgi:hypothetical protein
LTNIEASLAQASGPRRATGSEDGPRLSRSIHCRSIGALATLGSVRRQRSTRQSQRAHQKYERAHATRRPHSNPPCRRTIHRHPTVPSVSPPPQRTRRAGLMRSQWRGTIKTLPDRPPLAATATASLISLTS